MAKPDTVFIYIGTYPGEVQARDDYQVVAAPAAGNNHAIQGHKRAAKEAKEQ